MSDKPKIIFTLTRRDDPGIGRNVRGQVLYFYDDMTYGGLVSEEDNDVIDPNRRWRWEIVDDEKVRFITEKGHTGYFDIEPSKIIITRMTEYYLLLNSETKENSE